MPVFDILVERPENFEKHDLVFVICKYLIEDNEQVYKDMQVNILAAEYSVVARQWTHVRSLLCNDIWKDCEYNETE
jgi:hypothetical protein